MTPETFAKAIDNAVHKQAESSAEYHASRSEYVGRLAVELANATGIDHRVSESTKAAFRMAELGLNIVERSIREAIPAAMGTTDEVSPQMVARFLKREEAIGAGIDAVKSITDNALAQYDRREFDRKTGVYRKNAHPDFAAQ